MYGIFHRIWRILWLFLHIDNLQLTFFFMYLCPLSETRTNYPQYSDRKTKMFHLSDHIFKVKAKYDKTFFSFFVKFPVQTSISKVKDRYTTKNYLVWKDDIWDRPCITTRFVKIWTNISYLIKNSVQPSIFRVEAKQMKSHICC